MISEPRATLDAEVGPAVAVARPASGTRPFSWSVRRELGEYPAIYRAPLITAALTLLAFAVAAVTLPDRRGATLLDSSPPGAQVALPYAFAFDVIMFSAFLVWMFYCAEALHGERRDRSILFWKSLPVSDLTTVLAKASIPLVVLPALTFVLAVATQLLMLGWSDVVLLTRGLPLAAPSLLSLSQSWPTLLAGLFAMTLWNAPMYAWLLLVSAWARRAPLLWAVLPPIVLGILEKIAFHTRTFTALTRDRGLGWTPAPIGFGAGTYFPLNALPPARLLGDPALWIGLVFAAAFLAAAVRVRRHRSPL